MKKIIKFIPVIGIALFSSCKDDPEPIPALPDNILPIVSFVSPIGDGKIDGKIWNEITIEIKATDEDGTIAKVELFVNGIVQPLPFGPVDGSTDNFKLQWDSSPYGDSSVDLKAIATDNTGETSEVVITVETFHTLINYNLYAGYLTLDPSSTHFTYITSIPDAAGEVAEVLFFEEIDPNLAYVKNFVRPILFNDKSFDVHIVRHTDSGKGKYGQIYTYHDVSPGDFAPVGVPDEKGSILGELEVNFTNVNGNDYGIFNSTRFPNGIKTGDKAITSLYENMKFGYSYIKVGEAGYYDVKPDLQVGNGTFDIALNAPSNQMDLHNFTETGFVNSIIFYLYGVLGPNAWSPEVGMFLDFNNPAAADYSNTFHTPKDATIFDHYHSKLSLTDDQKTYRNENYSGIITSLNKLNATFAVSDKTPDGLSVTLDNASTHDVLITRNSVIGANGFRIYWTGYSKDGTVRFPPIPSGLHDAIIDYHSGNINGIEGIVDMEIVEYNHLNGYEEYLFRTFGRDNKTFDEGIIEFSATKQIL